MMNDKKQNGKKQSDAQESKKPEISTPPTEKKQVDYCIFSDSGETKNKLVGSVFNHAKGRGFNILIGQNRYVAFPPKMKV